jgi:predicted enzyme related to lactoylglutathione lyase
MSGETVSSSFGKFVWYDQMSLDLEGSGVFYKDVVGWKLSANQMNDQIYTLLMAGDTMVGGLMPIPPDAVKMGVRPAWMGYIAVDDVDAYAGKVEAAGGAIHKPPTDIANVGRFAIASDPHGGGFILFKGEGGMAPAHDPTAHGHFGWRELHAGDRETAFAFYSGLFGWTKADTFDMGPAGIYQLFNIDGVMAGGIMTKMAEERAPHWLYYITVEAADAAVARVKNAGGQVLNGPHEVPGGSWVVQALDPQGAMFGLVAPTR